MSLGTTETIQEYNRRRQEILLSKMYKEERSRKVNECLRILASRMTEKTAHPKAS